MSQLARYKVFLVAVVTALLMTAPSNTNTVTPGRNCSRKTSRAINSHQPASRSCCHLEEILIYLSNDDTLSL